MKKNNKIGFYKKIKSAFSYWNYKFQSLSFVKHILVFYLFITIIGSLILLLPISQNKNASYVDALFTSASAFSDTGLTTVIAADVWSYFGQSIIASLIFIGGIGWFSLKIYLFNILLGKPISFKSTETLTAERGSLKNGNTRNLIKVSVTILLIVIVLFSIFLTIYFYYVKPDENPFNFSDKEKYKNMIIGQCAYHNWDTSIRWGIFHCISSINNAGFDIIGGNSLEPYYHKYTLQIIFIILFVLGGIGFPVIYDIFLWTKSKFTKEKFHWSLFTKLSSVTYLCLVVISLVSVFCLEIFEKNTMEKESFWNNSSYGNKKDKIMAIIFNTFSTRNAGFSTINMSDLSYMTIIVYIILMFIGSAPSSTAGGIRTTTIAIIFLGIWGKIRGKKSVTAFNRRIPKDTVSRSYIVMTTAIFLLIIVSIISITSFSSYGGKIEMMSTVTKVSNEHHPFLDLLFEISSAFGTTGLSTGITSQLSLISKISIILLMFIGQLGVSSTLLIWDNKKNKWKKYELVKEDVSVG